MTLNDILVDYRADAVEQINNSPFITFEELGMDSLDTAELEILIDEEFGIETDITPATQVRSVSKDINEYKDKQ